MNTPKMFIQKILIGIIALLLVCALVVVIFDPFYHYHGPIFGMTPVLTDKEYQCVGTLRNFDYQGLIVGSSVAENNNNSWYEEDFGCDTVIKAIRSYGATADLCYLLDVAFEEHDPEYVFYSIDTTSLSASPEPTYETTGSPTYLYDKNPFNDYTYLWNKDVLFKKIPYMLVQSLFAGYDDNLSYNWEEGKVFSEEAMLSHYARSSTISEMKKEDAYIDNLTANINLLTTEVENHPDTNFKFFFPAYSILFWDSAYRSGDSDAYLYNEKMAIKALLQYDNVEVYYFKDNEEITSNLNNYMDTLHFTSEINHYMEEQMAAGECRVTEDTVDALFESMHEYVDKIENELVKYYEDNDMFLYDVAF
ncbi:MAG: SGNH/GDSL hydrolase family protein [Butyrivibrio sp.]|uniref:SGNH/GDSL hydrolase family protein n=1 Tax=Butyrivibrio sp. TaxID=28121 RepID=UPI0025E977A2|nr:SGNH/GDSL hydrolase family protein [Butyrivibrio sp.]MCR5772063.1 SGNH/GDSL hydrolase family protein [Butyrivibrio sp.]